MTSQDSIGQFGETLKVLESIAANIAGKSDGATLLEYIQELRHSSYLPSFPGDLSCVTEIGAKRCVIAEFFFDA
jgi:hypothetical protein